MYICIYVYIHVYTYMYILTYIHIHVYIYAYTYTQVLTPNSPLKGGLHTKYAIDCRVGHAKEGSDTGHAIEGSDTGVSLAASLAQKDTLLLGSTESVACDGHGLQPGSNETLFGGKETWHRHGGRTQLKCGEYSQVVPAVPGLYVYET